MPLVPSQDPGHHATASCTRTAFAAANTAVPFVNHDKAQLRGNRTLPEVRLHHRGHLRGVAGRREGRRHADDAARRRRRAQAMSTFAVGEEAEQAGRRCVIREVGKVAAPIDKAAPALDPGRPCASTSSCGRARSDTSSRAARWTRSTCGWSCRARDADGPGRSSGAARSDDGGKGPVKPGAHFYRSYQLDARRQPDQQAQRLADAQRAVRAADPAGRRRRGALPGRRSRRTRKGPITLHGEAELPQVRALLHAVRLCRQPKPGQDPSLVGPDSTTASTRSTPRTFPANVSGEIKDRIPDLPIVTLAAGDGDAAAAGRETATAGSRWCEQGRPRALERLGHRPAAAGRPEGRRVRVHAGHRRPSPGTPTAG